MEKKSLKYICCIGNIFENWNDLESFFEKYLKKFVIKVLMILIGKIMVGIVFLLYFGVVIYGIIYLK